MATFKSIGYQGVALSNNYFAAKEYLQSSNTLSANLITLITSKQVVENLLQGKIDAGIMAIRNSIIGLIPETQQALEGQPLIEIEKWDLTIRHAAFKLNPSIQNSDILFIASHPAALEQCRINTIKRYPNAVLMPIENTALGPKYLVERQIDANTVVLCSQQAGEAYGLYMDAENLSNNAVNKTTFALFTII